MTQDPTHGGLDADKVAELEHKLADAAAEVAKVQAQLSQAQHAGDPPAPAGQPLSTVAPLATAGAPATTIPAVPYAGTGPHVITINGQQVVPGSGNLLQLLQQLGKAGAAGGAAPVVMVNGQQVSGGQAVQIGSYLTPEVTQRIQSSLASLGLDQGLGAMFGQGGTGGPPQPPEPLVPLADPPRPVPAVLRLSAFAWSWWELFAIVMLFTAPIALWMFVPRALSAGLVLAVVAVGWFRVRRYRRLGLLKHGKVATVTNTEVQSVGTYYSGVTLQNMRVPQAHGWQVTRRFYSGPSTTTKIDYSVDGQSGSVMLRGLPYDGGVVLADPAKPERAAVVSQFAFDMQPGPDGQLVGDLSAWSWLGVICALVMESSLVALAGLTVWQTWFS
jgi:hypothetical protein